MSRITATSALVIVDVQNDFCPAGALPVADGDAVVPVINRISHRFDHVVASQDWHPDGHISFASQHPGRVPFQTATIADREWTLWPDHCVQGTDGADLHPGLDTDRVRLILRKGMRVDLDSYSVFYENDHRTPTGLDGFLARLGVTSVFLCGLATDVCVYFSARDAVAIGYETHVIVDASRGIDVPSGSLDAALRDLESQGVILDQSNLLTG